MDNALLITLIGCGMIFVGLILLWLMMVLLVRITSQKESDQKPEEQPAKKADEEPECKQRAAAAAVCAAIALSNSSFSTADQKEIGSLSPWQNLYRNLQINQANTLPRRKSK